MVIDSSAIIAILVGEPEEVAFETAIGRSPIRRMSPVNWFETAINAEKFGPADSKTFTALMDRIGVSIVPVDETQMRLAHQAWRKFGKGRHKARLNMGDCFAYALAKSLNEPLLFKGNDFPHTDIVAAV